MIQLKIAFLDEEEAYLEQLRGYLVQKKELFFQIGTFTSAKTFLEIGRQGAYDAVVLTEAFWEELETCDFCGKKILLCGGGRRESLRDCLFVSKYQSAENLFRQISAMLWQDEGDAGGNLPKSVSELIGIYSPVHHEGQILFSMTMAQILGEGQKVLYVNLMEHSGFHGLAKTEASEDIGDLLYGMMQENHDFAAGLHRVRRTCRNFDYISPAANPEHLSELTKPLLNQLLLELKNRSGYDIVIVDFGMVFLGFAEMLPVFSSFYCLGKEGVANRYRTQEFFDYLAKEGEHVMAHMNRLLLPEKCLISEDISPLDGSLYGGMGDYIRRCLYGGAEIGR